jgi:hypothetical protein
MIWLVYITIDPLGTLGASSSFVTSTGWKTSIWFLLTPTIVFATDRASAALDIEPLSMAATRMRSCVGSLGCWGGGGVLGWC